MSGRTLNQIRVQTPKQLRRLYRKCTLIGPATDLYDRINAPKSLGARGEREAERFLLRQGIIILARGYQDKAGEIDLIALDGETILFVEVKTRTTDLDISPAEAVDDAKQEKLSKTALGYLKWNRLENIAARFDVIAVQLSEQTKRPKILHYPNAFEITGDWQTSHLP